MCASTVRDMLSNQDVFETLKYRVETDAYGTVQYFNHNNQLHREGGPAVIWYDGTQWWCQNGKLHREDGPAITWADGGKSWYCQGQLHRTNGPAVVRPGYPSRWRLNGKEYPQDVHQVVVKRGGFTPWPLQ